MPSGLQAIEPAPETRVSRWGSRLPSVGTTNTELRRLSAPGSDSSTWTATRRPSGETVTDIGRVRL
ncbi:MAG: hypothetical protein J07HX64_00348 [halophilic archaeon J07HX64]|nr:MAG: hypothetical protein J07HX64_00348 [halophilic archaeon J07HX64]